MFAIAKYVMFCDVCGIVVGVTFDMLRLCLFEDRYFRGVQWYLLLCTGRRRSVWVVVFDHPVEGRPGRHGCSGGGRRFARHRAQA